MTPHETFAEFFRGHVLSFVGTGVTWIGAITAQQEQVEFWVKIAAGVGAVIVSVITVWSVLRRDYRESHAKPNPDTSK